MVTVLTKRLTLVTFGRGLFLRDRDGKLYTLGQIPLNGRLEKYPTYTGRLRVVFTK